MISFKEHFLLCEAREDMYAWMAPNGTVYPVGPDDVHNDAAKILASRFNISPVESTDLYGYNDTNMYDTMFNGGWMRITHDYKTLYCNSNRSLPNDRQLRNLKKMAEQNNMDTLVFDSGRREKELWNREKI
jgi:hypothetical protein